MGEICGVCGREQARDWEHAAMVTGLCSRHLIPGADDTVCTRLGYDRLRTALTDIVTLCMDVPATEDWRAKVGDKARKALYGEAAWETK